MVKGLGYRQENSWFLAGRQWGAMECLGRGGIPAICGALCEKCMELVGFYQGWFLRVTH